MPAYNFKDEFVPLVISGQKRTTIRQIRKQRITRVGDRLFLFNRMRQSRCRLIKDTECVKLTPIKILTSICSVIVWLDGIELARKEVISLAKIDGFDDPDNFRKFFYDTYGTDFDGELIEWRVE